MTKGDWLFIVVGGVGAILLELVTHPLLGLGEHEISQRDGQLLLGIGAGEGLLEIVGQVDCGARHASSSGSAPRAD